MVNGEKKKKKKKADVENVKQKPTWEKDTVPNVSMFCPGSSDEKTTLHPKGRRNSPPATTQGHTWKALEF
jgi:hypothetical protein